MLFKSVQKHLLIDSVKSVIIEPVKKDYDCECEICGSVYGAGLVEIKDTTSNEKCDRIGVCMDCYSDIKGSGRFLVSWSEE